jgi:hypothetical protein
MDSAAGHARGIVDAAILAEGIKLERELNVANERIKRLEEALAWYESTVSDCNRHGPQGDAARHALAQDRGSKAKEVKL